MKEIKKEIIHLSLKPQELLAIDSNWKGETILNDKILQHLISHTDLKTWKIVNHKVNFIHQPNHFYDIEIDLHLEEHIEIEVEKSGIDMIPCIKCVSTGIIKHKYHNEILEETCPECNGKGYFLDKSPVIDYWN